MRSSQGMDSLLRQQQYIDINRRSGLDDENLEPDFRYIGPKEMRDLEKLGDLPQAKNRTLYNSREFLKSYYKTGPKSRDLRKEFRVVISNPDENSKSSDIKIKDE